MDVAEDLVVPMMDTPVHIDRDAREQGHGTQAATILPSGHRGFVEVQLEFSDLVVAQVALRVLPPFVFVFSHCGSEDDVAGL